MFDYNEAFSRNIGWLTEQEQQILRNKRIAIAGMGGVGGVHLLTLVRLGIQNFNISDFDSFEIGNFNRQVGANINTISQDKAITLQQMAKAINPDVNINIFDKITDDNCDKFLEKVDLYVDGIDFFAVNGRGLVFNKCAEFKIPAITAAPIGMGVSYVIFNENSMSFNDYFQWLNKSEKEKLVSFMIGLTPKPMHLKYLVDHSKVDFQNKKGPSTIMACELCAGVVGTEVLKILLHRTKIYCAPYFHQFDAYCRKYKRGYLLLGNKNPIQKIKSWYITKILNKTNSILSNKSNKYINKYSVISKILDLARWAPSGDNIQP